MSHHPPDVAAISGSESRVEARFEPANPSSSGFASWSVGVWLSLGYVVLVAIHLWLARGVVGPIVTPDEMGYLGNARFLAGFRPATEMGTAPVYGWGYSLLLVPLEWVFANSSATLYRSVQVLNALIAATTLPLLWVFLRRVAGFESLVSLLAAAAGALYPATLVMSGSAWAENLLVPLTVVWALSLWLVLDPEKRPGWHRLLIVPITLWLHATHPRYLVILGLCIVGLVVAAALGWVARRVAAKAVVGLLVGWLASRMVSAWIVTARWPGESADQGSTGRMLQRLFTPSYLPKTGAGMVGQGWYLAVGSLGLVVVGSVALVWLVGRRSSTANSETILFGVANNVTNNLANGASRNVEVSATNSAIAMSERLESDHWRKRLVLAALGLSVAALFLTSVLSFVSNNPRVDHLIYGRYNESFAPILVALGLAALLGTGVGDRRRLVGLSVGVVAVLSLLLVLARGHSFFEGHMVWNNVLSLYAPARIFGTHWLVPGTFTLAAAGLVVAMVLLFRKQTLVAGLLFIFAFMGFSFAAATPLENFSRSLYEEWNMVGELERVASAAQIELLGLDTSEISNQAEFLYAFWMPGLHFTPRIDGENPPFKPDLVVGRLDQPPLVAAGNTEWSRAAPVLADGVANQVIWVKPGPVYELLATAGALLPPSWQSERPAESMQSSIEFGSVATGTAQAWDGEWLQAVSGDCPTPEISSNTPNSELRPVEISSGDSAVFCLTITNTDTRFAWPSDATWPAPGVVRIGQRWFAHSTAATEIESDSPKPEPHFGSEVPDSSFWEAPYRVPLPHQMWAGDSVMLPVVVHAIDDQGQPLASGEYVVGIDVLQEGFRWFSEPGQEPLRLSVIVRPAE